jgi:hypothetical protein
MTLSIFTTTLSILMLAAVAGALQCGVGGSPDCRMETTPTTGAYNCYSCAYGITPTSGTYSGYCDTKVTSATDPNSCVYAKQTVTSAYAASGGCTW